MIIDLRPSRTVFRNAASKIKKIGVTKRQRKNDDDYMPNTSELEAESSVARAGDDSEMEEDDGSDEDEIVDPVTLNFPGTHWTT